MRWLITGKSNVFPVKIFIVRNYTPYICSNNSDFALSNHIPQLLKELGAVAQEKFAPKLELNIIRLVGRFQGHFPNILLSCAKQHENEKTSQALTPIKVSKKDKNQVRIKISRAVDETCSNLKQRYHDYKNDPNAEYCLWLILKNSHFQC